MTLKSNDNRYKALRTISAIFKVLGLLISILPIIFLILGIALGFFGYGGGMQNLFFVLGAIVAGLFIYAQGEFIKLFIDIEANTRK